MTKLLYSILANYSDENYTDACVVATGSSCDYCCNVIQETCVRDIWICEPVYDRGTFNVYLLIIFVGSVVCGCPLIIFALRLLVEVRFLKNYYKETNVSKLTQSFLNSLLCYFF